MAIGRFDGRHNNYKRYIGTSFRFDDGSDSDWVVKLIDVYPAEYPADAKMANYQLMVASEILRGRYCRSFEKSEMVEPNKVGKYTIDLRGNDYTFKKGHRMMVQVQSTWSPLYDRNPQKFVENIFLAKTSDFQTANPSAFTVRQINLHISVFRLLFVNESISIKKAADDDQVLLQVCFRSERAVKSLL